MGGYRPLGQCRRGTPEGPGTLWTPAHTRQELPVLQEPHQDTRKKGPASAMLSETHLVLAKTIPWLAAAFAAGREHRHTPVEQVKPSMPGTVTSWSSQRCVSWQEGQGWVLPLPGAGQWMPACMLPAGNFAALEVSRGIRRSCPPTRTT